MADLVVITPSRGRPRQLREMLEAIAATAIGSVQVSIGVDEDDPADYLGTLQGFDAVEAVMCRQSRKSLCGWTNRLAAQALYDETPPRYLASLGDDHRPRTKGWDLKLIEAIEALPGPGFAYGRDLFQDKNMPTAWVASAEVVRALGWMMLPTCAHMYVDNAILELGKASGRIAYRPDVIIEHLHPVAHKAAWDESYRESNVDERYAADRLAFETWRDNQLAADVAVVEALVYEAVTDGASPATVD